MSYWSLLIGHLCITGDCASSTPTQDLKQLFGILRDNDITLCIKVNGYDGSSNNS